MIILIKKNTLKYVENTKNAQGKKEKETTARPAFPSIFSPSHILENKKRKKKCIWPCGHDDAIYPFITKCMHDPSAHNTQEKTNKQASKQTNYRN